MMSYQKREVFFLVNFDKEAVYVLFVKEIKRVLILKIYKMKDLQHFKRTCKGKGSEHKGKGLRVLCMKYCGKK